MIPGKHAMRQICILQHLHVIIGTFPLIFSCRVIHDITGMEQIFDVHIIDGIDNPFELLLLYMRVQLR